MTIETVAIVSTGDMGHAVGRALKDLGLRVVTCLTGRSTRTRQLAEKAGIEDIPSMEDLVCRSDAFLSIIPPAAAPALAETIAQVLRTTGRPLLYVDCNAISPQTTRQIGDTITAAGGRYVDAGIIGPPPRRPGTTRIYVSGAYADELLALNGGALEFVPVGGEIAAASAVKMCYAAMTKGTTAIWFELLMAAEALGITAPLRRELEKSQMAPLQWMERQIPTVPPKARRWVGEMEEIAATFEYLGLTPRIFQGAADMYRFIGQTPLGDEFPETADPNRTAWDIVATLREYLQVAVKRET